MQHRVRIPRSLVFSGLFLLAASVLHAASLTPPTLTATAASTSQINLSWTDPNTSESGYQVERSLSSASGFTVLTTTGANVRSFSSTGLAANTTYYYRVRALGNGNNNSSYSNTASARTLTAGTIPAAPSSLVATAASSTQINLSWRDNSTNETGFKVERATSSAGPWAQVVTVVGTAWSSTGLAPYTTYYFRVRATNSYGNSAYSNTASARTLTSTSGSVPAAPSTLAASAASSTQINLSWRDNSTNETAFKVERSNSSAGPWAQLGTTAGTTWSSTGLTPSTTYYFRVRATNSYGDSAYSNTAFATTSAGAATGVPAAPASLSATAASSSQINLVWADRSSNESAFKIERSTATAGWVQIGTVGANVTSYSSTGLTAGTAYSYRVRANNAYGDSTYSNTASATTTTQSLSGGAKWSKKYGGSGDDVGSAVAVDASGNVIVGGHYQGVVNLGTGAVTSYTHPTMGPSVDAFVTKYSSSGSASWSRSIGGSGFDAVYAVATDTSSNVIIAGNQVSPSADYGAGLLPTHGGSDAFVAKYSSSGGYSWAKVVGGTGSEMATGVAVDGSGNVFVTGQFELTADFGGGSISSGGSKDVFLVKYSSAGAHAWSKRIGGTGWETPGVVAADSLGNVIVAGTFQGTIDCGGGPLTSAGLNDIFVAKFTASAQHVWSKRFGGTSDDYVRGIAVDRAGDVLLTGQFKNTISFGGASLTSAGYEDIFLAKLGGGSGAHVWSKRFGSSTRTDIGYGVAVDANNNVAITGFFAYLVDFGGGALSGLNNDIFVAKYNSAGAYISAKRYGDPVGGADSQFGDAIAMSSTGNMYIAGHFTGTLDFATGGSMTSTAFGGSDAFLASLGP